MPTCSTSISATLAGERHAARRRQPALQHLLADPVPLHRPSRCDRGHAFHAAEGSRRSHGRGAGQQGLRPSQRHAATGMPGRTAAAGAAGGVPATAQGRFRRGPPAAAAARASVRSPIRRRSHGSSAPRSASAARRFPIRSTASPATTTCIAVGIDPRSRAEQLAPESFVRLAEHLARARLNDNAGIGSNSSKSNRTAATPLTCSLPSAAHSPTIEP